MQGKVTNLTAIKTHLGSDADTFWKRTAQETKHSSSNKQTVTLIACPCSSPPGNQTESKLVEKTCCFQSNDRA